MSDSQTWVEALNISPEQLTEWSQSAPARKPLLVHCLEQGLVDYGEYMNWAQEHFGLPVLRSDFFQSEAFDAQQFEQNRSQAQWHPWFFPVQAWEGVTFVACVEPPSETDENLRYVLADPRAMQEVWGHTSTSVSIPPPLPSADLPMGVTLEPPPFVLDLDNATFNLDAGTAIRSTPAEEASRPNTQTSYTLVRPLPEEALVGPPSKPTAPPKLEVVPKTEAPAKATAAPQVGEDGAVEVLFSSLAQRYSGAVIMRCREQVARLYRHDPRLKPSGETDKTTVNLSYPTFMRIVSKTGLPYHGYVVDSPAHREFFSALGIEKLPDCVTAIPIRFDDRLWGMVIATGKVESQSMDALHYAQEAVERLVNACAPAWTKAA